MYRICTVLRSALLSAAALCLIAAPALAKDSPGGSSSRSSSSSSKSSGSGRSVRSSRNTSTDSNNSINRKPNDDNDGPPADKSSVKSGKPADGKSESGIVRTKSNDPGAAGATTTAGNAKPLTKVGTGTTTLESVRGDDGRRLNFADRYKSGALKPLVAGAQAQKLSLAKQYDYAIKGDVARKLDLAGKLQKNGGWEHRKMGMVAHNYKADCMKLAYCGPKWFGTSCWYPVWSDWVSWSWRARCLPIFDPRPIYCRPVFYVASDPWVYREYQEWAPLPEAPSGTFVDVPAAAESDGIDVQLLAVRFVDPGHPGKKLGPRYRVWFKNNAKQPIEQPFDVQVIAAKDGELKEGLPQAGVRVAKLDAEETQSVDLRLPPLAPADANESAGASAEDNLVAIVDSKEELPDAEKSNNGTSIARNEIPPVDPALFDADAKEAEGGSILNLAGEGFGPEPGQLLVKVGGLELQGEILGWFDLGVRIRLPSLNLADSQKAELVVVRGDEAATNPLAVTILPHVTLR